MSSALPLLEDEVWSRTTLEIAGDVANSLGPPERPSHPLRALVNEIAIEMDSSLETCFFR